MRRELYADLAIRNVPRFCLKQPNLIIDLELIEEK
jgi:hypothetical protein